jgi:hypothetical protein
MADLTNEQLETLRFLSRHPHGCTEALLLTLGFTHDKLAELVFNGLATMQQGITGTGGRSKKVVWVRITPAGLKEIAVSKE